MAEQAATNLSALTNLSAPTNSSAPANLEALEAPMETQAQDSAPLFLSRKLGNAS